MQARAQLDYAKAGLAEPQVNLANAQRDYDRQKSLIAGHFVSQAAVDNSQTTLDALGAQLATQRSNVEVAATECRRGASAISTIPSCARPFQASSRSRPRSRAKSFRRFPPAAASPGPASAPSSTWIRWRSRSTSMRISSIACRPPSRPPPNSTPIRTGRFPAHVIAVIPTADRSKGTVTVRIALDQKDPRILPEMGVRVSFLDDAPRRRRAKPAAGVSLPANAVQASGDGRRGFRRARRAASSGARSGSAPRTAERVTVLSGLRRRRAGRGRRFRAD